MEKLAHFLADIPDAWKEGTQEQRNKLARSLLEQIRIEHNRLVFVKPRPEFEPFFKLNYEGFITRNNEVATLRGVEFISSRLGSWPLPRYCLSSL